MTTSATIPESPRACARPAAPAPSARSPAGSTLPLRAGLLAGALALLGACTPYVQGNGVLREETRSVDVFEGVSVSDGVLVNVAAGATSAARVAVTVSGDENIVYQNLKTEVRTDGETGRPVLVVYVDMSDFSTTHPLRVSASVPVLTVLRASGVHAGSSSQIDATVSRVAELRVSAEKEAIVKVPAAPAGIAADRLDVVLSSGAWLSAQSCEAVQADVQLTGASRAQLRASGSVTGSVIEGSTLENAGTGVCTGVTRSTDSTVSCPSPSPAP